MRCQDWNLRKTGLAAILLICLGVSAAVTPLAHGQGCPDGMIHYWRLDESAGPKYSDSVSTTGDATCSAACPTGITGLVLGAQQFDGTDTLNVADDGTYDWAVDASFTIEFWMRKDSGCAGDSSLYTNIIVGRYDGPTGVPGLDRWSVGVNCRTYDGDTGAVRFELKDDAGGDWLVGNTHVVDGEWHHIVALRDYATKENRIYVDGVLDTAVVLNYLYGFASSAQVNIGYLDSERGFHYDGDLDELAIYDRALTDSEILYHYYYGQMGLDFCADGFVPEVTVITPEPPSPLTNLPILMVRFTDDRGIDIGYYQMNDCTQEWTALWSNNSAVLDTALLFTVSNAVQGTNAVHFKITDDMGKVNDDTCSYSWSFIYDTVAPEEATVLSPGSGMTYAYLPTLQVQLTDNVGIDRAFYQVDGCAGVWTEIWSYNSGSSDTTALQTVPTVPEGTHSLYFKVTDDAGNVNSDSCVSPWNFIYDITAPSEANVLSPGSGNGYNYLPTLQIQFLDNINLDRAYYQVDGCGGIWTEIWPENSGSSDTTVSQAVPSVSEGWHSLYFKVTDDGGNVNSDSCVSPWSFLYDITPPDEVNVVSPGSGLSLNYLPTLELQFHDNLGLNRAYYQIDGCDAGWTGLWPDNSGSSDTTVFQTVPTVSEGLHSLYFKVTDDADNVNSDSCLSPWNLVYDVTDPNEANVITPESGLSYSYLPTIEVQFLDNLGLNRAFYQIDGCDGAWTEIWMDNSGSSDTTVLLTMPSVPEGMHSVYFKVTDDAGNANGDSCLSPWSFVYDVTAPSEPVVLSPAPGLPYNHQPTLEIQFVDALGLDQGYYQIDGCSGDWSELWPHNCSVSDTTILWEVPGLAEGEHFIYLKIVDDAGNANADTCSYSWYFTFDATPPDNPVVLSPAPGGDYNYFPTLQIHFQDTVGLDRGYYQFDDCAGVWMELWSYDAGVADTTILWQIPSVAEGEHFIYLKVTDDAGNGNPDTCTHSWSFTYDITPPSSPSDFVVASGHGLCILTWQNPTGDPSFQGVEIRRNPWADGAYPEFDDDFPEPMGFPMTHTQGWFVYRAAGEIYFDDPASFPRNVYYYTIFAFDKAGNYSDIAPGDTVRATNYWLGDVTDDGEISQPDLDLLSATFGTAQGVAEYNNEFDIGPTYDMSPMGIPTTDNKIDFEDLIVFAINFGYDFPTEMSDPQTIIPVLPQPNEPPVALGGATKGTGVIIVPATQVLSVGGSDIFWIQFEDELTNVKGVSFSIAYDEDYVTPTQIIVGPDVPISSFVNSTVHPQDSIALDFGVLEGVFNGPGTVFGIVVTADSATAGTSLDFARAVLRDPYNQDHTFTTAGASIEITEYECGDVNGDSEVDIDDAVYLIQFIFSAGPPPQPIESGNVDCSIDVDIDDAVFIIQFIFMAGNSPCDLDGDGVRDC